MRASILKNFHSAYSPIMVVRNRLQTALTVCWSRTSAST